MASGTSLSLVKSEVSSSPLSVGVCSQGIAVPHELDEFKVAVILQMLTKRVPPSSLCFDQKALREGP